MYVWDMVVVRLVLTSFLFFFLLPAFSPQGLGPSVSLARLSEIFVLQVQLLIEINLSFLSQCLTLLSSTHDFELNLESQ
jgi:hypothetical protein